LLERIRADFFAGQRDALDKEEAADAFARAVASVATADFTCVMAGGALTTTYEGVEGVRDGWNDFLNAFEQIKIIPGQVFETEDGVLEFVQLIGRPVGIDADIEQDAAAVWRVRDGGLAMVEFHIDRDAARASAGLSS